MKQKYFLALVFTVFLLGLANASFEVNDYSIATEYAKGGTIFGTLNISFDEQPINSIIEDSLGNEVSLNDLLDNSPNYDYDCSFQNCGSEYANSNEQETKTLTMVEGEERIIGFVFNGNLNNVESVEFNFSSNAGESFSNQVKLDILNDGIINTGNTVIGSSVSPDNNYGCYDESENIKDISFGSQQYCQRITLQESPGLMLGGWMRADNAVPNNITMKLYSQGGRPLAACNIPWNQLTSGGGEVFCSVDYFISEENDYYVCASKELIVGSYGTRGYSSSTPFNNCGFMGTPSQDKIESVSYSLGAKQKNFGTTGEIKVTDILPNEEKISTLVESFINQRYGGDCSNDCYIPIRVVSSVNQQITFNDLRVIYDETNLLGQVINSFFDFVETPSKISSTSQNLVLEGFFELPNEESTIDYNMYLDLRTLIEEEIETKDYKLEISPTNAVLGIPVTFTALLPANITGEIYTWVFSENESYSTTTNTIYHTYNEIGNYSITVTAKTSIGNFTTIHLINIDSAKALVTNEISKKKATLENIKNQILKFSQFENREITKLIDVTDLDLKLKFYEQSNTLATNDSEYTEIYSNISQLKFPKTIQKKMAGKSLFISEKDTINLDALNEASEKEYKLSDNLLNNILFWNLENLKIEIEKKNLLINWEDETTSPITIYEIAINPKKPIAEEYYIFIKSAINAEFDNTLSVKEGQNYDVIRLDTNPSTIRFTTTNTGNIEDSIFISPVLMIEENQEIEVKEHTNKWKTFSIIIAILIVISGGVYFGLDWWYKSKYENHLFPNKNELYNVVVYVNNSVKNNLSEKQIRENLVKVGWKKEQVNYLIKKYVGKNTGMPKLFSRNKNITPLPKDTKKNQLKKN